MVELGMEEEGLGRGGWKKRILRKTTKIGDSLVYSRIPVQ